MAAYRFDMSPVMQGAGSLAHGIFGDPQQQAMAGEIQARTGLYGAQQQNELAQAGAHNAAAALDTGTNDELAHFNNIAQAVVGNPKDPTAQANLLASAMRIAQKNPELAAKAFSQIQSTMFAQQPGTDDRLASLVMGGHAPNANTAVTEAQQGNVLDALNKRATDVAQIQANKPQRPSAVTATTLGIPVEQQIRKTVEDSAIQPGPYGDKKIPIQSTAVPDLSSLASSLMNNVYTNDFPRSSSSAMSMRPLQYGTNAAMQSPEMQLQPPQQSQGIVNQILGTMNPDQRAAIIPVLRQQGFTNQVPTSVGGQQQFSSPDEVRAALNGGQIDINTARNILQTQFGYQ